MMLATAMRAGALTSGSRVANVAAYRLVLAARPMATAAANKSTATTTGAAAAAGKAKAAPKKKAAAKPKAKNTQAKPKAVKKKAVKVSRPPQSPERIEAQKLAAKKKAMREKRIELTRLGLFTEPPKEPEVALRVFLKQWCAKNSIPGKGPVFQDMHNAFKALSPAELQELEETAAKNKISNEIAHKAWVQSHTPSEINEANKARHYLARVFKLKSVKGVCLTRGHIKDDRIPSSPLSPYMNFMKLRLKELSHQAPDNFRTGVNMTDAATAWKKLSEAERKVYEDMFRAERADYDRKKMELNL